MSIWRTKTPPKSFSKFVFFFISKVHDKTLLRHKSVFYKSKLGTTMEVEGFDCSISLE